MLYIDLSWEISLSPKAFIVRVLRELPLKTSLTIYELFSWTKHNNKKVEFVFNDLKFQFQIKQIKEFLHASFFSLSIYKEFGEKYELIMSDSPDILLIRENECIPIEVYEAFDFNGKITANQIVEMVRNLYNSKGRKNYLEWTRLLIANRYVWEFNISEFIREIQKYSWNFSQIILLLYRQPNDYTFFNVTPGLNSSLLLENKLNFSIQEDQEFLF